MENTLQSEVLEIPMDFRVACEVFGMEVEEFLQNLLDQFMLMYAFSKDDSNFAKATHAFIEGKNIVPEKLAVKNLAADKVAQQEFVKLIRLTLNRNYSGPSKRMRARKIVDKLAKALGIDRFTKSKIYLDENTFFSLNPDFRIWTLVFKVSPIAVLNSVMSRISLAEFYARNQLDQYESNAALAFFLTITQDRFEQTQYYNSIVFKEFMMRRQEVEIRYFIVRKLETLTELYRQSFLEIYYQLKETDI